MHRNFMHAKLKKICMKILRIKKICMHIDNPESSAQSEQMSKKPVAKDDPNAEKMAESEHLTTSL